MEIGCVTLSTETFAACRRLGCFLIDRIPSSSPHPPFSPFLSQVGVHRETEQSAQRAHSRRPCGACTGPSPLP